MASHPPHRPRHTNTIIVALFATLWAIILGPQPVSRAFLGIASFPATVWCAVPGPRWGCQQPISPELVTAAHQVKHVAEVALDVFELLVLDMGTPRADSVSYIDLWAMSDTASQLDRSAKLPEAARLASSLDVLKDKVMRVQDGTRDINHASWKAITSIDRWIVRVSDEIERQKNAGIVDVGKLHTMIAQMQTVSHGNIEGLTVLIDKTFLGTVAGIKAASEVRRDALSVHGELRRRLEDRSLPKKIWEMGSHAVKVAEEHSRSVQTLQKATTDVQKQLELMRGHLRNHQSNVGDFQANIDVMEMLSLDQELKEIQQLGKKIQKVISEAKRTHDANPRMGSK